MTTFSIIDPAILYHESGSVYRIDYYGLDRSNNDDNYCARRYVHRLIGGHQKFTIFEISRLCGRDYIEAVWTRLHRGCVDEITSRLCGRDYIEAVWTRLHRGCACAWTRLHRGCACAWTRLHRGCACAWTRLHRGCVDEITSRLYCVCVNEITSRLYCVCEA
jgi:hypothetical protein